MILDQKRTALAYRCPACGSVPTSIVGAFSLSGDLFKLKCPCGESHLKVERLQDSKMRLTVPCLVCPKPHTYIISNEVFFGSDIFVIPCNLCGIDICFIGNEASVSDAIDKSNEELKKIIGNEAFESITKNELETLSDPQILEIITYVISELNDEGRIYCNCSEGEGEYECSVYDTHVVLECKNCHASAKIEADSTMKAHELLNVDSITLK